MALRDLATAWVRANCPPDVQTTFLQHLDQSIQRRVNCSFMIGRDLTKIGKPLLVYCFRDEVFAWALTLQEAERMSVADNMLVSAGSPLVNEPLPMVSPVVSLEGVDVDNVTALDRTQPITGTVRYRTHEFITKPLAIRATCEPPGAPAAILSHNMFMLRPPEGDIQFSLPPLGDLLDVDGKQFAGLVPLFFQIWLTAQREMNPDATFPKAPIPPSPWPVPSSPKPNRSTSHGPAGYLHAQAPVMPAMSSFPPAYDPGIPVADALPEERPISDVRAVLVEIA